MFFTKVVLSIYTILVLIFAYLAFLIFANLIVFKWYLMMFLIHFLDFLQCNTLLCLLAIQVSLLWTAYLCSLLFLEIPYIFWILILCCWHCKYLSIFYCMRFLFLFFIFPSNLHPRLYLLIWEGGEREGGKEGRDRNIDRLSPTCALNLQPRYVPWLGIKPTTFRCIGLCSN